PSVKVPNWRAPDAFSAATKPGMSSSPWLLFLADSKSDDIHGPMQGGRDKDDGNEPEERITGVEPRDRPSGIREAQEERPDHEIVLPVLDQYHPGFVRLRRSAPTTKSYWSRTGAFAPRGLCIRRLRNAPARSPRSAPKARTAEAPNATPTGPNDHVEFGAKRLNGAVKSRPRNAPDNVPPTRPRHVFPSPKSRSRSPSVRPKSMRVPPPTTTAIGFATKAGRKNHKACGIASRAIAAG